MGQFPGIKFPVLGWAGGDIKDQNGEIPLRFLRHCEMLMFEVKTLLDFYRFVYLKFFRFHCFVLAWYRVSRHHLHHVDGLLIVAYIKHFNPAVIDPLFV